MPIKDELSGFNYQPENVFSQINKTCYFIEPFNDTIYNLSPKGITPEYYVDYGDYSMPTDYFDNISISNIDNLSTQILNSDYCFFTSNLLIKDGFKHFYFTHNRKKYFYFENQISKKVSNRIYNDLFLLYPGYHYFESNNDSTLLGWISAFQFQTQLDDLYYRYLQNPEDLKADDQLTPEIIEFLKEFRNGNDFDKLIALDHQIDKEDNPILIKFYLKKK